jgi:hypothetical protein
MPQKISRTMMNRIGLDDDGLKTRATRLSSEIVLWNERQAILAKQPPAEPRPEWHQFEKSEDPGKEYSEAVTKWNADQLLRWAPVPFPTEHPLIADAIAPDGTANYEVVEDVPASPTEEELKQVAFLAKKKALLQEVEKQESLATTTQLPPGKIRLHNMKAADIDKARASARASAHDAAWKKVQDKQPTWDALRAKTRTPEEDAELSALDVERAEIAKELDSSALDRAADAALSDDDKAFLAEYERRKTSTEAIQRWAAQASSDIEDLTADTIDSWKLPPLPTI